MKFRGHLLTTLSKIITSETQGKRKLIEPLVVRKPLSHRGKNIGWLSRYNCPVRRDDIIVNSQLNQKHLLWLSKEKLIGAVVTLTETWQCKLITALFIPDWKATGFVSGLCVTSVYHGHQVWRSLSSLIGHLGIQTLTTKESKPPCYGRTLSSQHFKALGANRW